MPLTRKDYLTSLPAEILDLIVSLSLRPHFLDWVTLPTEQRRWFAICRVLRAAVLSNPLFWSTVHLTRFTDPAHSSRALDRSGDVDLTVCIYLTRSGHIYPHHSDLLPPSLQTSSLGDFNRTTLPVLKSCAPRIRRLHVLCDAEMDWESMWGTIRPCLTARFCGLTVIVDAPSATSLNPIPVDLAVPDLPQSTSALRLVQSHISDLDFGSVVGVTTLLLAQTPRLQWDHLATALRQLPVLSTLHLVDVVCRVPITAATVELPCLSRLSVTYSESGAPYHICSVLNAPRIQSLRFDSYADDALGAFIHAASHLLRRAATVMIAVSGLVAGSDCEALIDVLDASVALDLSRTSRATAHEVLNRLLAAAGGASRLRTLRLPLVVDTVIMGPLLRRLGGPGAEVWTTDDGGLIAEGLRRISLHSAVEGGVKREDYLVPRMPAKESLTWSRAFDY